MNKYFFSIDSIDHEMYNKSSINLWNMNLQPLENSNESHASICHWIAFNIHINTFDWEQTDYPYFLSPSKPKWFVLSMRVVPLTFTRVPLAQKQTVISFTVSLSLEYSIRPFEPHSKLSNQKQINWERISLALVLQTFDNFSHLF